MPDIRHAIQIAARPESIYPLTATAQGFAQWWAEDVTESQGVTELGFFRRTTIYRVRLIADQSPTHAEWRCESGDQWNGTRLAFELEARGESTLLRFAHVGWDSETEYFTCCNTTWGELMYRLKAKAEGKGIGPLFLVGALAY